MTQILFFISLLTCAQLTYAKSSEIPDKREFPVNPKINPCENFYEYTCSKVNESFQMRPDRSHHVFSFSDSAERLLEKKKTYFKNLSKTKPENEKEVALKNFYSSCMNTTVKKSDEKAEVARIKTTINSFKTRDEFLNWIEQSYLNAETSPLEWGTISNQDIPVNNDLYLVNEFMSLPEKSYYEKKEVTDDLNLLIKKFLKTIGENNIEAKTKIIMDFETGLAKTYPTPEQFRQIVNNRNPIERNDLLKKYPQLKLEHFLTEVPQNTVIRNWVPESLNFMNEYLATQPLENLKIIYIYNSLKDQMDDSYPAFFQAMFDFRKKHFGGPDKRPDRQERCTRLVMRTFSKELDSILVDRFFPQFPTEKFISLAEKIRGSILESLESNNWLTSNAKKEAILKMKKARLQLVKPMNDKEWNFLPQATYSKASLLTNLKTINLVHTKKNLQELKEPSDPNKWDMSPLTVNAYYDASQNKFVMPIGILQYPFYDPTLSDDINLGAVGAVIGHELGHGIDDQGARYDSVGKQRQWMDMKDLKNFSNRSLPLINQFDKIGHNGKLTLGENIGDLVGLTYAYNAASKNKQLDKKEFFLSYARLWCNVSRPKFDETQLKTDPHSLGYARVNEQVKQQVAFKEAYQCKEIDPMVLPKDQLVRIW